MTEAQFKAAIAKRAPRIGDTGPAVQFWQKLLISKGYKVAADGDFGQKTQSATLAAQAWANVLLDGLVGPITYREVKKKTRTKRPVSVVRHNTPGVKPKIVDCRNGRNGFPQHRSRRWEKRRIDQIRAKLGHHTGGPGSFVADARFHVNADYLTKGGAPAIAYAIGVDLDGTILVFNDWNSVTWHCDGGHNTDTLGIVVRGNTDRGTLTRAQRRSLAWLWKALSNGDFGFGYPKMPATSTTHRHVNSTSCPGEPGEKLYRSVSGQHFRTSL